MQLTAALRRHEKRVEVCALNARDEAAAYSLQKAREAAPVLTGRLRDSIQAQEGKVFTPVPYAAHVEFGGPGRPPRPFLSAAADMHMYLNTAENQWKEAVL